MTMRPKHSKCVVQGCLVQSSSVLCRFVNTDCQKFFVASFLLMPMLVFGFQDVWMFRKGQMETTHFFGSPRMMEPFTCVYIPVQQWSRRKGSLTIKIGKMELLRCPDVWPRCVERHAQELILQCGRVLQWDGNDCRGQTTTRICSFTLMDPSPFALFHKTPLESLLHCQRQVDSLREEVDHQQQHSPPAPPREKKWRFAQFVLSKVGTQTSRSMRRKWQLMASARIKTFYENTGANKLAINQAEAKACTQPIPCVRLRQIWTSCARYALDIAEGSTLGHDICTLPTSSTH